MPGTTRHNPSTRMIQGVDHQIKWTQARPGTRMADLRAIANDEQLAVLRILIDRRPSF